MIDSLLSYIAPHPCYGCGKNGTLLCDNCKYDIIEEDSSRCVACGGIASRSICTDCKVPYERAWCLGERVAALRQLLDGYKFENVYEAHRVLGDLLSNYIGRLPPSAVLVPVPTIGSHIRQRGYDHTLLLAKRIAKNQRLPVLKVLKRAHNTRQRGASKSQRIAQAKKTYFASDKLDTGKVYVIIDDIVTTGATVKYAAKALKNAGAKKIWVAVVARQPLD